MFEQTYSYQIEELRQTTARCQHIGIFTDLLRCFQIVVMVEVFHQNGDKQTAAVSKRQHQEVVLQVLWLV
jgi:hypothetical protein